MEAFYEDDTKVPQSLSFVLPTLKNGDLVVLVWKNGMMTTEVIVKANDGRRWFASGTPLFTCTYAPFKLTFHDKDILAIVNVSQIASTHGGV